MRFLLIPFIFILLSFNSFAQSSDADKKIKKSHEFMRSNNISLTATLELELLLFYERMIGYRHSIELGFGKKWSNQESTLSSKTDQTWLYGGNIYNLAYRYYFGFNELKSSAFYISPLLFYKDYSFDHTYIYQQDHGNQNIYDTQIRSSNKTVYGGKLLFGYKINITMAHGAKKRLNLILDFYTGLGIRYKTYKDILYASGWTQVTDNCNCPSLPQPQIESNPDVRLTTVPSFQLGGRIGIGF